MMHHLYEQKESASCGVGLLVSLAQEENHDIVKKSLKALINVEHRGGVGNDYHMGDGAGIMTSIPFELFGYEKDTIAVATIFAPRDAKKLKNSLEVFEKTFLHYGLEVLAYRDIPIDENILSPLARGNRPTLKHVMIKRPAHCRTLASFEKQLYLAKQMTRTAEKEAGISNQFFFTSLSPRTIVYKALCRGVDLAKFYRDLENPHYKTNFALFHRRFSTNTTSTWDKVQPFRLIAHNGEINTIEGNRAWSITREKALGLRKDELVTHESVSDSGNFNGIVEGLKYRSSIPQTAEILSILMPPANGASSAYYKFWSRGMEPWDGPALVAYSDGKTIGARLDRNGLRPCRWMRTESAFYLCSEAGAFALGEGEEVLKKGALYAGSSVTIHALSGSISFLDSSESADNLGAHFEANLRPFEYLPPPRGYRGHLHNLGLFQYSKEDLGQFVDGMVWDRKEPIGSMGDTARLAFLSDCPRSLFDFFYQDFAQVTNPPLDYIREKAVTDMRVYLGRKPNIFEPKEFIPPKLSLVNEGPILSLGQLEFLKKKNSFGAAIKCRILKTLFKSSASTSDFLRGLDDLGASAIEAVKNGCTIIILSDREADRDHLPFPSILALRTVVSALNRSGRRLRTSLILDTGDIKNSHHIACTMGFGATGVCPYLILERAYFSPSNAAQNLFPKEREKFLIQALNAGVLKIMAKMGISVLRSYQGSKLFSIVGLGKDVMARFFSGQHSLIGGPNLDSLVAKIKADCQVFKSDNIKKSFLFKEHAGGKFGEQHTLTSLKSKIIHRLVETSDLLQQEKLFRLFKEQIEQSNSSLRHLLALAPQSAKKNEKSRGKISSISEILKTFGSGGMSFGAISAEAQRDLILAFREIGGRSNSGEGGENPYYFTEGIHANVKQIASGRFGVTGEYLVTGDEVQIKIAQGAKPGEGGQLMGVKVTPEIAQARFSRAGVELISPAPQHDIYSIEDLAGLIYELKELSPALKVSVKLVAGKNIGAIAMGVVKAGADIIQISGGEGGTGAAGLLSMKHAGLPLEWGLIEVHHSLVVAKLRDRVLLRADGGLMTGKDLLISATLGADQFDFGKIVLLAEGCVMARICEKNTCPTGIATHDKKFKEKYRGNHKKVVILLKQLAQDTQRELKACGVLSLSALRGRTDLLVLKESSKELALKAGFELARFKNLLAPYDEKLKTGPDMILKTGRSLLNGQIIEQINNLSREEQAELQFSISNTDRAIPAGLVALYAIKAVQQRAEKMRVASGPHCEHDDRRLWNLKEVKLNFEGSAGQSFGLFLPPEIKIHLKGEANDFVGKGLCGGEILITPSVNLEKNKKFRGDLNTIIGNCALYGATSGSLSVFGRAGDRFAIRNSGAHAIVMGVGIHALEYMTGGKIIILGEARGNIGAGMTGGVLFLKMSEREKINSDYIVHVPLLPKDQKYLEERLLRYIEQTNGQVAKKTLEQMAGGEFPLLKYVPRRS